MTKNIEKKLRQIAELEEKLAQGQELNEDQFLKIESKASLLAEMKNALPPKAKVAKFKPLLIDALPSQEMNADQPLGIEIQANVQAETKTADPPKDETEQSNSSLDSLLNTELNADQPINLESKAGLQAEINTAVPPKDETAQFKSSLDVFPSQPMLRRGPPGLSRQALGMHDMSLPGALPLELANTASPLRPSSKARYVPPNAREGVEGSLAKGDQVEIEANATIEKPATPRFPSKRECYVPPHAQWRVEGSLAKGDQVEIEANAAIEKPATPRLPSKRACYVPPHARGRVEGSLTKGDQAEIEVNAAAEKPAARTEPTKREHAMDKALRRSFLECAARCWCESSSYIPVLPEALDDQEVEAFIERHNLEGFGYSAARALRDSRPEVQAAVMARGGLEGANRPQAIMLTRIREEQGNRFDVPVMGTRLYTFHMRPSKKDLNGMTAVNVKDSSFKCLGRFFMALEKDGILSLKPGWTDPLITAIFWNHPELKQAIAALDNDKKAIVALDNDTKADDANAGCTTLENGRGKELAEFQTAQVAVEDDTSVGNSLISSKAQSPLEAKIESLGWTTGDYVASTSWKSPVQVWDNGACALSVETGDIVYVDKVDKTGWAKAASKSGVEGWLPAAYLRRSIRSASAPFKGGAGYVEVDRGDAVVAFHREGCWAYGAKIGEGGSTIEQGWFPTKLLSSP
jgi:hypothetical protein